MPTDKKSVIVSGTAKIKWSIKMPMKSQYEKNILKEPAREIIIDAVNKGFIPIYLWGLKRQPAEVSIQVDENDIDIVDDGRTLAYTRCKFKRNGARCCLEENHTGVHRYLCASENRPCPGYPYPASERKHPVKTCGEKERDRNEK